MGRVAQACQQAGDGNNNRHLTSTFLAAQSTPGSGLVSLGALKVPGEEAVSDEAAQVLEALRAITTDPDAPDYLPLLPTTDASDEGYLLQLGQALAARVPFVRFALRASAPKRPSSPARDPSWALRTLRHTMLVGTTSEWSPAPALSARLLFG